MARTFEAFDTETIDREFFELNRSSSQDAACLIRCMNRYCASGRSDPNPAIVKHISNEIYEIRHKNSRYAGRCLFFREKSDAEALIILLVFRKEGQALPKQSLEAAIRRIEQYRKGKGER